MEPGSILESGTDFPVQERNVQPMTGDRSRASSPQLVVCSKHLQDNDEAADGDEENDDSDCSGVGGPASSSTRCSSSAIDLRDVSGSSLNLTKTQTRDHERRCMYNV